MARLRLSPGPRRAAIALWSAGAVLAGGTCLLSLAHSLVLFATLYAAVAGALAGMAVATHREHPIADTVSLAGLGGQIVGAFGAAWELRRSDDGNAKARHLRQLGVNYRWALTANLAYSLVASGVFLWVLRDLRRHRRTSPRGGTRPADPEG